MSSFLLIGLRAPEKVEARQLEHHYPHALQARHGKAELLIFGLCSNFLGFAITGGAG